MVSTTSHLFDSPNADLVLRSSTPKGVEFRVHQCILAQASPFFEHMFQLPQPEAGPSHIPVVDVSESSQTLEYLLRYVYPVPKPDVSSLDELVPVLEAASKYDFTVVIDHLRTVLVSPPFLASDPVRVYAIACRFDLDAEARLASRHTLTIDVLDGPLIEDLKGITAYQYHQLLNLHRARAAAAQELLILPDTVKCMMCNGTHYGAFYPPKWWKDYEERARKELAARPTADIIFSMPFIAQSAHAGCERCAGSIFDAHWFFADLRKRIDDLPGTI
ncbi:hypothetical protein PHLGIDRAFT_19522 [Phlebiopsis gigantea 11061_1 CR5-6]|uniref:BTB domain-containing protein n=1 Tax=Phlebiopsis gigantea (strain 11061_1 CR5-6) TaxID=745531 RepID=A0A0C3S6F3_PHLG1|nr:hypothetical protein PHLGIDRAFT_19522 [Phlebiopsis gigantea 11061_1 CR5-6]